MSGGWLGPRGVLITLALGPGCTGAFGVRDWLYPEASTPIGSTPPEATVPDDEAARMLRWLEEVPEADRPFQRFVTSMALDGAGRTEEDLDLAADATSKVASSLSWRAADPASSWTTPRDIDGRGQIFAIDLRDLGWDVPGREGDSADGWELLVKDLPDAPWDGSSTANELRVRTGSRLPYLDTERFVATAVTPSTYYALTLTPTTLAEWTLRFGVELEALGSSADALLAGTLASGVALHQRHIVRTEGAFGGCWLTFDYASDLPSLSEMPLPSEFLDEAAGGEAICSLPNGLHAYFIYNAAGERVEQGDPALVAHPDRFNAPPLVVAGESCFRCHPDGLNTFTDVVRSVVLAPEAGQTFTRAERAQVRDRYPTNAEWEEIRSADIAAYTASNEATRLSGAAGGEDPITHVVELFRTPLTLTDIAAVLRTEEEVVLAGLRDDGDLATRVGLVTLEAGGSISREAFDGVAHDLRCALPLGNVCGWTDGCGRSGLPCLDGQVCRSDGACVDAALATGGETSW